MSSPISHLFNPIQPQNTMQPLAQSPTSRIKERTGRVKAGKCVGWDRDSSVGKEIAAHTSKAKQEIQSMFLTSRQVFSPLQESQDPACGTVTWEDKTPPTQTALPFPPPLAQFIYWVWCHVVCNIPLVGGVTCPGCVSSQFPTCRAVQESGKALALCKHCSAVTKPSQIINPEYCAH